MARASSSASGTSCRCSAWARRSPLFSSGSRAAVHSFQIAIRACSNRFTLSTNRAKQPTTSALSAARDVLDLARRRAPFCVLWFARARRRESVPPRFELRKETRRSAPEEIGRRAERKSRGAQLVRLGRQEQGHRANPDRSRNRNHAG